MDPSKADEMVNGGGGGGDGWWSEQLPMKDQTKTKTERCAAPEKL
jgi:hypothetical protein